MSSGSATRRPSRGSRAALLVALLAALSGCAGRYFREIPSPPSPPPQHRLDAWPYRDYWTGVIFNGEKIGLTHLAVLPADDEPGLHELRSEALLAFHFLGFHKQVTLRARDWVGADLTLRRFVHDYDLDGRTLRLTGRVEGNRLMVQRETPGRTDRQAFTLSEAEVLYPTSAIPLYPTLHGLEVGRRYGYRVFDGQRESIESVTQRVEAYQESELYQGRAFRVETAMGGQDSTLWLNERGEPVLEMAWHGVLISALETEKRAKSDLARASLNKRDALVEFSRIRVDRPLPRAREATDLEVAVTGLPDTFTMPSDALQQCATEGGRVRCRIRRAGAAAAQPEGAHVDVTPYLKATPVVDSADEVIRTTAREIAGGLDSAQERVRRLLAWLQEHVAQKPVDVFTARQVFDGREAECQGLTWLYAAFARSLGIPTRVTNGLVYSTELDGFLYHTWAESYVDGRWLPVDPTFAQVGVDATHIKLLDGERASDLLPLVDVVGRIRLEILGVQPS